MPWSPRPGCPSWKPFRPPGWCPASLEDDFLGRVGLFRNQPGDVVVAHADVLIAIGYDAVEYDPVLWNATPSFGRTVVHIDSVPAEIDNNYQPTLELLGNVAATLAALTENLAGLTLTDDYRAEIAAQRKALADIDTAAHNDAAGRPRAQPGLPSCCGCASELDDTATITCDIGSVYIFMARHFRVYEPQTAAVFQRSTNPGCGPTLGDGRLPGATRYAGCVRLRRRRIPVLRTRTRDRDPPGVEVHPHHLSRQHLQHGGLPGSR